MGEVAELLGRAPLPPRWALGYLQSTRHFDDTDELRRLPRTIRDKRIPCDALIFLSTYGDALGWNRGVGHLEFQPELCPTRPRSSTSARAALRGHHATSTRCCTRLAALRRGRGARLPAGRRATSAPRDRRPPPTIDEGQRYLDFSNPAVRRLVVGGASRAGASSGVAGWWLDGGEGPPAAATLHGGDGTAAAQPLRPLRHAGLRRGRGGRPARSARLPALPLGRGGHAALRRRAAGRATSTTTSRRSRRRSRSASTPACPACRTGAPTSAASSTRSRRRGELYARWFQFGAFCPIFRSHGWVWREHVPWAHGPEVEAICRDYRRAALPPAALHLHAGLAGAHAGPAPDAPAGAELPRRSARLGPRARSTSGATISWSRRSPARAPPRWPVYLPAGVWYDFWTGEPDTRARRGITVDAPLDRLPLLVRARRHPPAGPGVQHTGERPLDEITLLDLSPERPPPASSSTRTTGARNALSPGPATRSPPSSAPPGPGA